MFLFRRNHHALHIFHSLRSTQQIQTLCVVARIICLYSNTLFESLILLFLWTKGERILDFYSILLMVCCAHARRLSNRIPRYLTVNLHVTCVPPIIRFGIGAVLKSPQIICCNNIWKLLFQDKLLLVQWVAFPK